MIATEFRELAAEIAEQTGADIDTAYRLAWEQMPELLNDVMMDVRYQPARVVMLLTPHELMNLTNRE